MSRPDSDRRQLIANSTKRKTRSAPAGTIWSRHNGIACTKQVAAWVDGTLTSFHQVRSKEPWPSRTVFLPGGRVVLIHFTAGLCGQRKGGGPSQVEKFETLKELGHSVAVVSKCDEAVKVVRGAM